MRPTSAATTHFGGSAPRRWAALVGAQPCCAWHGSWRARVHARASTCGKTSCADARRAADAAPAARRARGAEGRGLDKAPAGPSAAPAKRDLPDPAPARDDAGKVGKHRPAGALFAGGVHPKDVGQGALGDCYLCAGLSSVAHARPEAIRDAITAKPDGTYDVRLFDRSGKPQTVSVDGELYRKGEAGPRYARGTDAKELWPAIYEKAYAQYKGSYEAIGKGGQAGRAMQTITGKPSDRVANASLTADQLWDRVHGAVEAGRPIAADTHGREKKYEASGLVSNHAYSVLGTQTEGADRFVTLRNPWASTEYTGGAEGYGTDVDLDGDGKLDGDDGVFRMKLGDFQRLFEHTDVNDPPPAPGIMDRVRGRFGW